MADSSARQERVTRMARDLAVALRGRLRRSAPDTTVAHRSEGRMHVWRFRDGSDDSDRYLRVAHGLMARGRDAAQLLGQLDLEQWEERLFAKPRQSLVLSPAGRLVRYRG